MSPDRPSLVLSMSALIAPDAPLTSPISDCSWDQQPFYSPSGMESFSFEDPPYSQQNSPSPYSDSSVQSVPAERALKMRMTPDYASDSSDGLLCLPTSKVFDIPDSSAPPSPTAIRLPIKRASSPAPSATSTGSAPKKARVTTKDFVPPDVTGLSKREARLVKNRAAAFLSRQRKREEFETMEIRVAELEKENARLQALAQPGSAVPEEHNMLSEIDQLRAQLAAAEQRERELSSQLSRRPPTVKIEAPEARVPASPARPTPAPLSQSLQLPGRSSASLSLLVLLCALPSIFSMPPQSQAQPSLPTTGSFPLSNIPSQHFAPSGMDLSSYFAGDSFDWRMSSAMELDRPAVHSHRRLEFVEDAGALGLSGLDISFDTQPSADGKIRVRIHNPSSSSSMSPSYNQPMSPTFGRSFNIDDPASWGMHLPPSHQQIFPPSSRYEFDPFFGVGGGAQDMSFGMDPSVLLGTPAERHIDTAAGRRRVRIALKSMPHHGTDGGEWEVELC